MRTEHLGRGLLFLLVVGVLALPLAVRMIQEAGEQGAVVVIQARMPENGGWSPDVILAEAGQPLHLRLVSQDVVHGFAVGQREQPALDLIPGQVVETTLVFDTPGRYTYYCTRWCGPNHWRMRGTIEVAAPDGSVPQNPPREQPLYLRLGLDLDAPRPPAAVPDTAPSAERGALLAERLPGYVLERSAYERQSPAGLWQQLRDDPGLQDLSPQQLWDLVALVWQRQGSDAQIQAGQQLYAENCAACHGEQGRGDGVMVKDLPPAHSISGHGLVRPPDFTDPQVLLGASPALLEGKILRGGMGTGMPYWGPIFNDAQINAVISYLYTFAFQTENWNNGTKENQENHP